MRRIIIGVSSNSSQERIDAFNRSVRAIGCEPVVLKSLRDALTMLSSTDDTIEVIALNVADINSMSDGKETNIHDVLNTIRTMCCMSNKKIPPVLAYSKDSIDPKCVREILNAGVKGFAFTNLDFTLDDRIEAWEEIIAGRMYLHRAVQDALKPRKSTSVIDKQDGEIHLTPRQIQVRDLICTRGSSNKSIARLLDISESTVKLHTGAILKKYGLTNRTQLALFAKSAKSIKKLSPMIVVYAAIVHLANLPLMQYLI